jgi:hypothetical protein
MKIISLLKFIFLLLIIPAMLSAQASNKVRRDSMMHYHNTADTNYIRKYPDKFIVTLSQSYREYDMGFWQTLSQDTIGWGAPTMKAGTNWSSGASIDFDKISFCFGLGAKEATPADIHKYGQTTHKAFSLSFSAYRFRFEGSYRNYQGFYYSNSRAYDTLKFDSTGVFLQNPSMNVRSIRVKTIFIFNKKHFSYSSAFFNTQRQLKSTGSWLLINNIYQNLWTTDSSFIPAPAQPLYKEYGSLNYFKVVGLSFGPGYSYNLVLWKTLYANATLTSGFDFQHRTYNTSSGLQPADYWKVGYAGDLRLAIGLNGKRCFCSFTFRGDYNNYVSRGIRIGTSYYALDFNLGYRFRSPHGKLVRKMQANKWYQMM